MQACLRVIRNHPSKRAVEPKAKNRKETRRMDTLARLEQVILERRNCDPETSYVALMKREGRPMMARKLGEEAVEAVVAALSGSDEDLVGEAADVMFHLMALLADREIPLADVFAELERREGISGIEETASRQNEGENSNAD